MKDKIDEIRKFLDNSGLDYLSRVQTLGFSGGKDSTACYLVMMELFGDNFHAVHADTGNEHPITEEYVRTLHLLTGGPEITIVSKEATEEDFARRRQSLAKSWAKPYTIRIGNRRGEVMPPFDEGTIQQAIEALKPSGNRFLDMMLLHGMMPMRGMQFCTEELKLNTNWEQHCKPLIDAGHKLLTWAGVRAEESRKRAGYDRLARDHRSQDDDATMTFLPIFHWTAAEVFDLHKYFGVEPNPLYKHGMNRVGCMPCINASKDELRQISQRFPEHIEKIKEWEKAASTVNRWTQYTGSTVSFLATSGRPGETTDEIIRWANTDRKGNELADLKEEELLSCSSRYGLCE